MQQYCQILLCFFHVKMLLKVLLKGSAIISYNVYKLWHQHIINNQTMNSYFTHNSKEMFIHCMFFLWSLSLWCYISFWSWKTEQDRKQWQRIDIVLRRSEYLSSRENMILFKEYRVTLQQDLAAPSLLPKKQPMVNDLCEAYCTSLLLSFSFSITACIISY